MSAPMRVWITGASRGLGAALAGEYARAGADVILSARASTELAATALALPAPGRGHAHALDVTVAGAFADALEAIEATHGPLDMVILNAGTFRPAGACELDCSEVRALFELNFFAVVSALENLIPRCVARRGGHLVVIGSLAGDVGLPYAGAYSASKAALNRLCQALAPELATYGVRLSVVNPGFVATPLSARNRFPMPCLVSAEWAARTIRRGLAQGRFEIRFPWRMSVAMRLLALLPRPLLFALTRRMLRPAPAPATPTGAA